MRRLVFPIVLSALAGTNCAPAEDTIEWEIGTTGQYLQSVLWGEDSCRWEEFPYSPAGDRYYPQNYEPQAVSVSIDQEAGGGSFPIWSREFGNSTFDLTSENGYIVDYSNEFSCTDMITKAKVTLLSEDTIELYVRYDYYRILGCYTTGEPLPFENCSTVFKQTLQRL